MRKILYLGLIIIIVCSCQQDNAPLPNNNSTISSGTTGYYEYDGHFYKTTNSSVTWTAQNADDRGTGLNICFVDATTGYYEYDGHFYKTTNSGVSWTAQNADDRGTGLNICFVN